jgi:hypothetical protein
MFVFFNRVLFSPLLLLISANLLADTGLEIAALPTEDAGVFSSTSRIFGIFFLFFLVALAICSGILPFSNRIKEIIYPRVKRLFLKIKFKSSDLGSLSGTYEGFLRELSTNSAVIISSMKMDRGSIVTLYLKSLAGFSTDMDLDAHVVSCKSLGGVPASFLVEVKFGLDESTRKVMLDYLELLGKHYKA